MGRPDRALSSPLRPAGRELRRARTAGLRGSPFDVGRGLPAGKPSGFPFRGEIDWVLGPTPEDVVRQLQPMVDLGVSHLTMYFWDLRSLRMFAREVMPAFA